MKLTGITRFVDGLGRVVLPKGLRQAMDIHCGDSMEIFVDVDRIILRKFIRNCIFCGNGSDVRFYHGMAVCQECAGELIKNVTA